MLEPIFEFNNGMCSSFTQEGVHHTCFPLKLETIFGRALQHNTSVELVRFTGREWAKPTRRDATGDSKFFNPLFVVLNQLYGGLCCKPLLENVSNLKRKLL